LGKNMKEIQTVVTNILEDRGIRKIRMNVIREKKIFGFIKPI